MRYTQETGQIRKKTQIAPGIFDITVALPKIASVASIGQFVNVLCDGHVLRRPLSLCGFDREQGWVRLVFEVRGKGTAWLAERREGDDLDVVGPLGHGFTATDPSKRAILVGGGVGTPPLLPLAGFYGANTTAILGFRTCSAAILKEDFQAAGAHTIVCTDDGTAGLHGFTTQALQHALQEQSCDIIYTCGPKAMMRAVAELAAAYEIPCQVSLEERMGCGIGACLCCVCKTKGSKGDAYTRVCLNGPVFSAQEVDWNA